MSLGFRFMMNQLMRAESPAVSRTFAKKQSMFLSRTSLVWTVLNISLAAIMYFEMTHELITHHFNLVHPIVHYIVRGLALLFTLSTLVDFLRYIVFGLSSSVVELNKKQRTLLGVSEGEPGFRCASTASSALATPGDSQRHLAISASTFGCYLSTSGLRSPGRPGLSPLYAAGTPPSFCGSAAGSPGSPLQTSGLLGQSAGSSFNRSGTWSPLSPNRTVSPLFGDKSVSPRRRSRVHSPHSMSTMGKEEEYLTDVKALSQYLNDQQEIEDRTQHGSAESPPNARSSFWNFNRSMSDFSLGLRKYRYQVACRSTQSSKSKDDDNDDPTTYQADEVWQRLAVHPDVVELWVEKLRKWLRQTILSRLVDEINAVNETLVHIGSEDMQIGEASLSSLKQLAVLKGQHLPTLNSLLPFLEVSSNQEYLVRRIKDLNAGGCLSEFRWSGGGQYKGKPWAEHLPTDASVVMHLLCSYLDSRLPPHPKYPDGKTFTCEHFLKAPDKTSGRKSQLYMYESRVNPPHYKVIIGDDTWNLLQGRNNMFHAILLFLHHIKTKECGMLGRVNLGMSGINILWVLDAN